MGVASRSDGSGERKSHQHGSRSGRKGGEGTDLDETLWDDTASDATDGAEGRRRGRSHRRLISEIPPKALNSISRRAARPGPRSPPEQLRDARPCGDTGGRTLPAHVVFSSRAKGMQTTGKVSLKDNGGTEESSATSEGLSCSLMYDSRRRTVGARTLLHKQTQTTRSRRLPYPAGARQIRCIATKVCTACSETTLCSPASVSALVGLQTEHRKPRAVSSVEIPMSDRVHPPPPKPQCLGSFQLRFEAFAILAER